MCLDYLLFLQCTYILFVFLLYWKLLTIDFSQFYCYYVKLCTGTQIMIIIEVYRHQPSIENIFGKPRLIGDGVDICQKTASQKYCSLYSVVPRLLVFLLNSESGYACHDCREVQEIFKGVRTQRRIAL